MMKLESLANELLLNIFEYLNANDLQPFYGQNSRFNTLIFNHLRDHGLLFRSLSKPFFDTICRKHLPSIVNKIKSLHLSDNDDTPQQTDCFFTYSFTLHQFTHLRSLTLHHINSQNTIKRMMSEWFHLPMLTHLNLDKCYFRDNPKDLMNLVNNVWSLPKLRDFNVSIVSEYILRFPVPRTISSTLKHLSVVGAYYESKRMDRLFENTPYLRSLSAQITSTQSDEHFSKVIPSINKLNISFDSIDENTVLNFLQKLPNLHCLTIRLSNICINGGMWEKMIRGYLPKLNRFEFKIEDEFLSNCSVEKQIERLLDSFRSRFWINEHRWFVRCDLFETRNYSFYTLPYAFNDFHELPILSKSTCLNDSNDSSAHNRVRSFTRTSPFDNQSTIPHIRFNRLHHLSIKCPIGESFWSTIPDLNRLRSLNVYWYDGRENYQSQLQTILDRAPHLYSLSFLNSPSSTSQMISFRYKSASVRQLDLRSLGEWYNKRDCTTLRYSSLGIQCESLLIRVENRACIFDLVYTMPKLRALNVRCREDTWNEQSPSPCDELIQWLELYMPSSCTITRDRYSLSRDIRLWIR